MATCRFHPTIASAWCRTSSTGKDMWIRSVDNLVDIRYARRLAVPCGCSTVGTDLLRAYRSEQKIAARKVREEEGVET